MNLAFFRLPRSLNGINVMQRSLLFQRLTFGTSPIECMVNGNNYAMWYYLADRIYPFGATFAKSYQNPQGNTEVHFTTAQEAVRNDVGERL